MARLLKTALLMVMMVQMATAASAQTPEPTPNTISVAPEKRALIDRYFVATRLSSITEIMVNAMLENTPRSRFSASEQDALRSAVIEATQAIQPLIFARFVEIYARAFSIEELEALVGFYESPVGRSLTAKTAALADEAGRLMPEYQTMLARRAEAIFCAQVDCSASVQPSVPVVVMSGP